MLMPMCQDSNSSICDEGLVYLFLKSRSMKDTSTPPLETFLLCATMFSNESVTNLVKNYHWRVVWRLDQVTNLLTYFVTIFGYRGLSLTLMS